MLRPRVAVEEGLRPVRERLEASGYDVVGIGQAAEDDVAAVVVTGMDTNVLGNHDIISRVSVINADGMTPEQVTAEVARRLRRE